MAGPTNGSLKPKKKKNKRGTRSKEKRDQRELQWLRKQLVATITAHNLEEQLKEASARLTACPAESSEAARHR